MGFTPSEFEEIRAAVEGQIAQGSCSLCGERAFSLGEEGFVLLTLRDDLQTFRVGGPALPCIAMTCSQCGKTELLNAFTLGLGHLVERYSSTEPAHAG